MCVDGFCNFSNTAFLCEKNSTTPARFSRFGRVCFCKFSVIFRVRFLDGFGNGSLLISAWIWGLFWLPKSIKTASVSGVVFERLKNRIPEIAWTDSDTSPRIP